MSNPNKTLFAAAWSSIQAWGHQVIALCIFAILAKLLAPDEWGIMAMANVALAFLAIFQDQGISTAIVQRKSIEPLHLTTAFWTNFTASLLLAVLCYVSAGPLANAYSTPELKGVVELLAIVLPINSLGSVHVALLKKTMNFKPLAARTIIAELIGGITAVVLAYQGAGVYCLVAQRIVASTISVGALWFAHKWRPSLNYSIKHFVDLFSFGANILGLSFLNFINRQSDNLLIALFLGPTALGYYNIAYRLYTLISGLVNGFLKPVMLSRFSSIQGDEGQVRKEFYMFTAFCGLVAFPVFLGLLVTAPNVVNGILGEKWQSSILVLQILALVGAIQAAMSPSGPLIIAMGKPQWSFKIGIINATANFIGFAIAVHYGIVAVAAAFAFRALLLAPLPVSAVNRLICIEMKRYLSTLYHPLVGALLMTIIVSVVSRFLNPHFGDLSTLILSITLGAIVYALYVLRFQSDLIILITNLYKNSRMKNT